MADEKISLELLIESGNSAKTLGDLKTQFTKLNQEIEKVDAGSEEFTKLQREITKTGAKVKNLELSLESLDKEQVATSIGGVAGGIGDITNALVLLGGENDNLNEMVTNITTAMGVSMGLKGAIEGASDGYKLYNRFLKANATVLKVVTIATKTFRKALIATGIGALIALVGALFTNLDTVKGIFKSIGNYISKTFSPIIEFLGKTFEKVGKYISDVFEPITKRVIKLLEDLGIKETEVAKKTREANEDIIKSSKERRKEIDLLISAQNKQHKLSIAQMDREIALAKANGIDTTQLERERMQASIAQAKLNVINHNDRMQQLVSEIKVQAKLNKLTKKQWEEQLALVKELAKQTDGYSEAYKNSLNDLKVFEATKLRERKEANKKASEARITRAKEDTDKRLEEAQRYFDEVNRMNEEFLAKERDRQLKKIENERKFKEAFAEVENLEMPEDEDEEPQLFDEQIKEQELLKEQEHQKKLDDIKKRAQEENRKRIEKALNHALSALDILTIANDSALERDLAKAGNNEAKKEQLRRASFERNKKMQLISATIDGYKAVTSALAQPLDPISKALYVASTIATSLANLNKIRQTQYEGGGSTSVSGGGSSLNIGQATGDGTSGVGIEPVSNTSTVLGNNKVYVTETDITSTQNKVEVIQNQSTF